MKFWLVAAATWAVVNAVVLILAPAASPLHWGTDHHVIDGGEQVIAANVVLAEVLALAAVVHLLTRRRTSPDLAARAPSTPRARAEVLAVLGYGAVLQAGGWLLGRAMGWHPIGFHLAGSVVGTHDTVTPAEAMTWAVYNVVGYAALPYAWFRRRYSAEQLCLRSTDRRGDALVILVVLLLESAVQLLLLGNAVLGLACRQLMLGLPLTFVLYLLGTVLPTTIFVQAILVPRYRALTGSSAATIVLGGLTYAALHVLDAWTLFGSPREAVLSVLVVTMLYAVPGGFKTFLTVRTGNAWVHAWAYHAVAPHLLQDAPLIVRIFRL
ncbi:hypothetical protein KZZ52_00880 [Dactylosporangium sp. AC04546]|uniref:hypothetical protein n=1 Tax=Dactylosporangium sp. AC04546 TaxID=2862460 RepID=UPI001EDF4552|nr:hypothetical protein [Dactylosporangium sp. AC04546]WVK84035.1 hypothetical protein KZZ52_00880 [Dactylosporangium sp. AC04546]